MQLSWNASRGRYRHRRSYLALAQALGVLPFHEQPLEMRPPWCACRQAQEGGDYGEAILLCVDCFQGVESMAGLTVRPGEGVAAEPGVRQGG